MKKFAALLLALVVSNPALARDEFKVAWSIYAGWMPWGFMADEGIIDKWADKYDIKIEIVQINDYIESINQYTFGDFDACVMTNMDALTIPAASGVDSTALIVGSFSNGNDGIVLKGADSLDAIKGQNINMVELSVSHYLLARGLETVGMTERDVRVVNTSDADLVAVASNPSVTAVATWNPLLNEILSLPDTYSVFDSSMIPGEIIDLLVANTETIEAYPAFAKALTGAWYETMSMMVDGAATADTARTAMATAAGTDLEGYNAQLAVTEMFYNPADAIAFMSGPSSLETMQRVAEFSFEHALLGDGAPSAEFIGIETPAGVYGDPNNIKLRFNPTFTQMAVDGEL
ncbi:ABC transporter substrate-binding protein [Methylophaga lonarensis MPL]|uniref:ABC transporter substrate-binding protein n=1 Tax=Methylophaga lonarensis MPL TaxID=1286106 RepID=M7NZS0_9GAMM|nr:putative urea ABC transporter substrate-binding protein [Methylophaga lonarensis]EMR12721.1 ABC transporter substrate-binding protein [Methylophaga lonarensis MPL]